MMTNWILTNTGLVSRLFELIGYESLIEKYTALVTHYTRVSNIRPLGLWPLVDC